MFCPTSGPLLVEETSVTIRINSTSKPGLMQRKAVIFIFLFLGSTRMLINLNFTATKHFNNNHLLVECVEKRGGGWGVGEGQNFASG